jgi:hypothetical protein
MKKIDLGQAISIIGNAGVIAGLIFVGFQLQQDRQIAIVNGLDTVGSTWQAWVENVSTNRELWVRGMAGESLSDVDLVVFNEMAATQENFYFRNWTRNRLVGNAVNDAGGDRWVREAALTFHTHPGLMRYWREHNDRLSQTISGGTITWVNVVNREIERLNQKSN